MAKTYTCSYADCTKGEGGKPRTFEGRRGRPNKYCSHECYSRDKTGKKMDPHTYALVMRHRVRKMYTKRCANCLNEFTAEKANRVYCGVPCASAARGKELSGKTRKRSSTLVLVP